MPQPLKGYLDVWEHKPVLRLVYDDFYNRIISACLPGITIEIGGGVGNFKRRMPDAISTDIQFARWLDCVADAQHLPFAAERVTNIVMVDVLHHIEYPVHFFREAARVLRPGGRIVMVEPAITGGSMLFYRLLHHEPVRMSADPLVDGTPDPRRDPYASNQAIPTLIATRDKARFETACPMLKVERVTWFAFATYPLSGGFKRWSLMPRWLAPHALRWERGIEGFFGRFGAFRMMLIVQKKSY